MEVVPSSNSIVKSISCYDSNLGRSSRKKMFRYSLTIGSKVKTTLVSLVLTALAKRPQTPWLTNFLAFMAKINLGKTSVLPL